MNKTPQTASYSCDAGYSWNM